MFAAARRFAPRGPDRAICEIPRSHTEFESALRGAGQLEYPERPGAGAGFLSFGYRLRNREGLPVDRFVPRTGMRAADASALALSTVASSPNYCVRPIRSPARARLYRWRATCLRCHDQDR